jgi:hypothetical protein
MSQHMEALGLANEVRIRRAQDRRDLQTGTREDQFRKLAGIVERNPAHMNTLLVLALLKWANGMGHARAAKLLFRIGMNPRCRLGELTDWQRGTLVFELEQVADGAAAVARRRAA